MSNPRSTPDLSSVGTAQWEEARRRFPIVRRLVDDPSRTRAQVIEAAAALGLGVTQTYALLRRYQADPRLTSLLPQHRGPARGYSRPSGSAIGRSAAPRRNRQMRQANSIARRSLSGPRILGIRQFLRVRGVITYAREEGIDCSHAIHVG